MLVLSRKLGEKIRIGDDIEIVVVRIGGGQVSIGVAAPKKIRVDRNEVREKIEALTVDALLAHISQHPAKDFTILTLGPQPLEVNLGVS